MTSRSAASPAELESQLLGDGQDIDDGKKPSSIGSSLAVISGQAFNQSNNQNNTGDNDSYTNWQSMLNPNNDLLKNLIYGDLNGMLENK